MGWVLWHKNKAIAIPNEVIAQIRATPTITLGWFDEELMAAWKHILPITPTSVRTGFVRLDHPA